MRIGRLVVTPTCINIPLTTHSSLEVEIGRGSDWKLFECSLRGTRKTDHAGFEFNFEICKLVYFCAKVYDNRHWNSKENRWNKENEY